MEGPHFHISFVPKQGNAINHIADLIQKEKISGLISDILKQNRITPQDISFQETGSGKGKTGGVYEGFHYKKYLGKLSGERKKILGSKPFITRFELSLLKSKKRDGIMIRSMDQHGTRDAKVVTEGLFQTLVEKISEDGPINWNQVIRSGTI
ncbi:MAG: hypothetical protein ABIF92_02085 [archaeon]